MFKLKPIDDMSDSTTRFKADSTTRFKDLESGETFVFIGNASQVRPQSPAVKLLDRQYAYLNSEIIPAFASVLSSYGDRDRSNFPVRRIHVTGEWEYAD